MTNDLRPGAMRRGASGPATVEPLVHVIPLVRVQAHLVNERPATLIDAGLAGSSGRIAGALAARGRSLSDVTRVICTHGHPDHAGGARELAELGIEILIHPADAEAMRTDLRTALRNPSRGRFFASMTPELPSYTPINDRDVLPILGGLEVIHTPGHTPGSVCLYGARDRVLFVGDVLQRRFGRVSFASALFSDDYASAKRTLKRLATLDVEVIMFGHYPALTVDAAKTLADLARRTST
jgi:glyoxylase-like metal-dependent hydrolase (beta-lactamase superfamily II)